MIISWKAFKKLITAGFSVQGTDDDENYFLNAVNGASTFYCLLSKANKNDDLQEFEASYLSLLNKKPSIEVSSLPPYGAKTQVINGVLKKLYARYTGFQQEVSQGANEITYVATYPWAKVVGVEVINASVNDTVNFKVYDNAQGTYSGVPDLLLNQFSFSTNLPKDFYRRESKFDADLYQGMIVKIEYTSTDANDRIIGFNLDLLEVKS